MIGVFIALGIAILTLLAFLLWFVPHLLQQQAMHNATESAELREILADMINEQEAVAMRQAQLGTSISYLQDQLEQLVATHLRSDGSLAPTTRSIDPSKIHELERHLGSLHQHMDEYLRIARLQQQRDNESWAYLMSLLGTMQERLHHVPDHPRTFMIRQHGHQYEHHRHR